MYGCKRGGVGVFVLPDDDRDLLSTFRPSQLSGGKVRLPAGPSSGLLVGGVPARSAAVIAERAGKSGMLRMLNV